MSVFRCKMCGATLKLSDNLTFTTCDYCLTQQTLPRITDEKMERLYDRANHFRRNNEFDKAMAIYEQILDENNEDSESYWSLILCKYGIEYVEDPHTHKRIPTVHRTQYTSIFDDEDYKSALKYAYSSQRVIYENEANAINEIQKNILTISQKEAPFDVFICYKETDDNGMRTYDSVYANELYHELTEEGFKVFFSRITLEDKLGSAYEPYIFAALNSAKVMVVIGTKPEYFNAVWVKNEWSRYLSLVKNGAKKVLIPAYRDMSPYDLPEEFSHLQAQDMNKLGFMPDLIRGIKKLVGRYDEFDNYNNFNNFNNYAHQRVANNASKAEVEPLMKRLKLFVEHAEWDNAEVYCDRVLDVDPENAQAYIYKLLVHLRITEEENLKFSTTPIEQLIPYKNALRFADDNTVERLLNYNDIIKENIKKQRYNEEMQRIAMEEQQKAQKTRNDLLRERARLEDEYNALLSKQSNINFNIEANRKFAEDTVKKKNRIRNWGIICLIFSIFPFVFVNRGDAIFGISFLLMLIFSGRMYKVNGRTVWMVIFSLMTVGIFPMIYAIVSLNKSKKIVRREIVALDEDFNKFNYELNEIAVSINNNRQALNEVYRKIAELNKKIN